MFQYNCEICGSHAARKAELKTELYQLTILFIVNHVGRPYMR